MDEKTKRAIRQIPWEIRRNTRVLAAIGEAVTKTKIKVEDDWVWQKYEKPRQFAPQGGSEDARA